MQTTDTQHYIQFESSDDNGNFIVRICKGGFFQLQLKASDGDEEAFVNLNKKELTAVRDMINKVIDE